MGVAPSTIEDDKALVLCQERKRFVREAIDGTCALATAHCDYIQSLRDTGFLLRKCFEHEASEESIPNNKSPSSFHASHMKAAMNSIKTYLEKVAVPVTVTMASASSQDSTGTPPLDHFDQIHPGDNQFSLQDKNKSVQHLDKVDDLRRFREEGIPELEEEGERTPSNDGEDFAESKDDFANEEEEDFAESKDDFRSLSASFEALVPVSNNKSDVSDKNSSMDKAPEHHGYRSVASKDIALPNTDCQSDNPQNEMRMTDIRINENDRIFAVSPVNVVPPSGAALPMGSKEPYPYLSISVKDLYSGIVEIDRLFSRACDSGKEVTRFLDEDKLQFRALLPEETARGSESSSFLATLFACCMEDVPLPETPSQAEVKYLHRSVSSQLSPSRNPPGVITVMHTSTLDKLYAWEGKLYDEVKADSAICRRYDEKCKQLRYQESRGKNRIHVDFTRATVKDLHSRILVAIQKIDFISKSIEEIRDKELQPQLDELIRSLTRMWETMLECHQIQHAIMKLASSKCSVKLSFQSESQYQDVLLLSAKLSKLCSDLQNWVASHKAYLSSLNLWLHKCMKPLKKRKSSRKKNAVDVSLTECAVSPIFTTCEIWIKFIDDLPTSELVKAIEVFSADLGHSLPHQQQLLNGETGEILRNNAPANLKSSLMALLEKLEAFSAVSVQMYIDLQKNIDEAKERFWRED